MAKGRVRGPRFVSVVLLAFGLAHTAGAQPVASVPPAEDLFVPGGLERLFHAAGLEPPRDRAYALLTLSRLVYHEPLGGDREQDTRAGQLRDYLDALGQWCIRVAPFPKGVALREAHSRTTRGQLEELLAFVGLGLRQSGGKWLAESHGDADAPRRRASLSVAGIDVDRLEQRLNAGETVDLAIPGDTVPLPLAPASWLRTVFDNRVPPQALFALLIGEREALWLYCGLLGLDNDTRRFIESAPDLLAWIHRNRPALFGAFGRSLHVRAGRVETPGGAGSVPLWESLAGASTTQPTAFVRSLLEADAGRLAWFYDTVAHLPPEPQAVVAARFEKDGAERRTWFRSLYSVFLNFYPSWNVSARPFIRRALDPALALQLVSTKPDGRIAGPRWMSFWEQALRTESLPERVTEGFKPIDTGRAASLPGVLGRVFAPTSQHRARFDLVLFVGRVFGEIDEAAAFDSLVAARGFMRFPALMLVLERMGVREPKLYAEAARAAALVSSSAGSRAIVRVVQLQGALALLDRLREVHALETSSAATLARSLFAVRPGSDGWYEGAILGWLEGQVLPALGVGNETEAAEARVMMALAGIPRVPLAAQPAVEWNGQRYRVDPARVVLARLLEVRGKQHGPNLDTLLAAWHRATDSSAPSNIAAAEAEWLDGSHHPSTLLGPALPGSESHLRRLDHATAEWLASLAYAVRIDDVDAPVLLGANPALTHDLRLLDPRLTESGDVTWSLPAWTTALSDRTHLEGSLLGLGLPLSRYAATRLKSGLPAHRPTVHELDEAVVMASVAAFNPLDVTDAERDGIAAAVRGGRAQVAALVRNADSWTSVAEKLHADEWERELVPWMLTHEPERVAARFSAHDLFTLGGGSAQGGDGWGILARPIDGSLSLRLPTPVLRRELGNQSGVGVVITQFCDLQFRIAGFLAESRLPASLARALLAMVAQEFLGGARLSHDKDWPGLVVAAGAITNERLAEYVRKLTSDGTLVREGGGAEAADRGPGCAQLAGWWP